MKKVLLTATAMAFAVSVFAQGTVNFVLNSGTLIKAPVYGPEGAAGTAAGAISKTGNTAAGIPAGTQTYAGALLSGSGYLAQIFAGAVGSQAETFKGALSPVATFRTGGAAGFIGQVTATLDGIAKDAPNAAIQVRAWDNSSGNYPTWAAAETAWKAGLIAAGTSAPLTVNGIGGDVNAAPFLQGIQSFNIYYVPEPSTMALAGLGAAALLIFRRRK